MSIGQDIADKIKQLKKEKKLDAMLAGPIDDLRKLVGEPQNGRLTYEQLSILQTWLLERFDYKSDEYIWNESDHWDTTAWMQMLLWDKKILPHHRDKGIGSDCDFWGYALLGVLYYVFGYSKNDIFRVACATETNEGHFVVWVKDEIDIYYQMENRVQKPRSIKYMRDLGYEYWHYSSMKNVGKWFNAKKKVALIIYDTPNNLASDKPDFRFSNIFKINKSKTLVIGWFQFIISTMSAFFMNFDMIGSTLQAHRGDLSNILDPKSVSIIMIITSIMVLVTRVVTHKSIEVKKDWEN